MSVTVRVFDKNNKQDDFQYMAKDIETNKYVIGYIAIDKPWYSPENMWTYYIIKNKYSSGGFCGGCSDLGFEKIIVDKDTIEPYNQIASIKFDKEIGLDTRLVNKFSVFDDEENTIAYIKVSDEIPYELWDN